MALKVPAVVLVTAPLAITIFGAFAYLNSSSSAPDSASTAFSGGLHPTAVSVQTFASAEGDAPRRSVSPLSSSRPSAATRQTAATASGSMAPLSVVSQTFPTRDSNFSETTSESADTPSPQTSPSPSPEVALPTVSPSAPRTGGLIVSRAGVSSSGVEQEPARLPLAFQDVDPASLTGAQREAVDALRKNFVDDIGGAQQNPDDPSYPPRWKKAQEASDAKLRAILGTVTADKMALDQKMGR